MRTGCYVAAQLAQEVVFRFVLPAAPDTAAEIALRLLESNRASQGLVVATSDSARRVTLVERFDLWDGAVAALYLPLLAAHALASAGFAIAVGGGQRLGP